VKIAHYAPWVSRLNLPLLAARAALPYLIVGLCFGATLALLVVHACGCQAMPKPPENAQRCGSDWDCPDGYSCAFPDVDTYAVCLWGNDHRWDLAIAKRHMGVRRPKVAAIAYCTVRGLLPDPACTPGAVETTDMAIVCGQSTQERRNVPASVHRQAFAEYGLAYPQAPGAFEVDHLIPLELGGSNDISNLWPESAPGFRRKDKVENDLHRKVCEGQIPLERAQKVIAADWTQAEP
jgi:hypothetical protein